MVTSTDDVMAFVYKSFFNRNTQAEGLIHEGSHPLDDRNNRQPWYTLEILEQMGRPDKEAVNVLVTGSKGKGTISRLLERIIRAHGIRTGLFTSPHLHVYNERIRVCGEMISDSDLIAAANTVKPISEAIESTLEAGAYISPMGNGIAMALKHFSDTNTEINILECGRGARFDDVAAVDSAYAVIGAVFDEHIPYLGRNLEEVAWHKAGIMHASQKRVFSAKQEALVDDVLRKEAQDHNLAIAFVETVPQEIERTIDVLYNRENAALAYLSAQGVLGERFVPETALEVIWAFPFEGCLERVSSEPEIRIDGCIHPVCAKAIAGSIDENKKVRFIVGVPDNKAYAEVVHELLPVSSQIILTKPAQKCHLPFEAAQRVFAEELADQGACILYMEKLDEAIDFALNDLEDGEALYIVGTQIYLGEVKTCLGKRGVI